MDLLRDAFSLDSTERLLLTLDPQRLPARVYATAQIENSMISPGCTVRGRVSRSILSPGVVIEEGALVQNAVILHDTRVSANARIVNAVVDQNVVVGEGAEVGQPAPDEETPELAIIGMGVEITPGTQIPAGTHLEPPPE